MYMNIWAYMGLYVLQKRLNVHITLLLLGQNTLALQVPAQARQDDGVDAWKLVHLLCLLLRCRRNGVFGLPRKRGNKRPQ